MEGGKSRVRTDRKKHHRKPPTKPTGDEPRIAGGISRKFQISEDIIAGEPLLMGYGRTRLCIENYRNIIEYTENLIRIQTKTGRIHVRGEELVIAYYRDDSMCIVGKIQGIEYH
ncbi:MAG: YabP/YqfC family sporulation protein [Lachnospiraceae bacterium]|nr:YabP/YqfC family sporulation protein [Lachnospiraceae bacterium]